MSLFDKRSDTEKEIMNYTGNNSEYYKKKYTDFDSNAYDESTNVKNRSAVDRILDGIIGDCGKLVNYKKLFGIGMAIYWSIFVVLVIVLIGIGVLTQGMYAHSISLVLVSVGAIALFKMLIPSFGFLIGFILVIAPIIGTKRMEKEYFKDTMATVTNVEKKGVRIDGVDKVVYMESVEYVFAGKRYNKSYPRKNLPVLGIGEMRKIAVNSNNPEEISVSGMKTISTVAVFRGLVAFFCTVPMFEVIWYVIDLVSEFSVLIM